VTVEREWKSKKVIIEEVPAEVCEQCGEMYFGAETTLRLEKIKKASEYPQEKKVTIPASIRNFNQLPEIG
jgi:YgiT-type zinc finger domain-containing protein